MRYGIVVANLREYADPRVAVRVAQAAEEAGWEAFFVWDHLGFVWGSPTSDPWVVLAAAAVSTTRLKLGTALTPLARRRPQVVAEIRRHRTTDAPFEVAVDGYSEPGDSTLPRAYGATWWLQSIHGTRAPLGEFMARVEAGPPETG
jgi:hypothetical protein